MGESVGSDVILTIYFFFYLDLVNGDKGKILTLFVNVLKVWPL